jgi:hypothetical protein
MSTTDTTTQSTKAGVEEGMRTLQVAALDGMDGQISCPATLALGASLTATLSLSWRWWDLSLPASTPSKSPHLAQMMHVTNTKPVHYLL